MRKPANQLDLSSNEQLTLGTSSAPSRVRTPISNPLLPVPGAWVRDPDRNRTGRVEDEPSTDATRVLVRWLPDGPIEWVDPRRLRSGFQLGMTVQDIPRSATRSTLGEGRVLETRTIGHREQVLVEFPEPGERCWLPFENLRHVLGVEDRFVRGTVDENADRFRLRCLAHALSSWNQNTGALSRLDIDPLPHQIHLVHHILASGNLNWMIADDVGLGKTIEVGMLLAALQARKSFRRILLITPAGLVRQWQDELHHKFGMDDFEIYGTDFNINAARQWKMHDCVIGSIDRFKADDHRGKLLQAGSWDLIVFDEAHRLSRRQWGKKFDAAARFTLAADLRKRTESMLLLTGTPHQGMEDKFQALLELLRPELFLPIRNLALNPEILSQMVIRNQKADVTDADGNFIFHGKSVRTVDVTLTDAEAEFDDTLQEYLQRGYRAADGVDQTLRAIGFVMTIYRKLAASSIAAIETSLRRRLDALETARDALTRIPEGSDEIDQRYFGEWEEQLPTGRREFFDGEMESVQRLLRNAAALRASDSKLTVFRDILLPRLLRNNPTEKVLIFTEYRTTQDYLVRALTDRYGDCVATIHGGQKLEERAEAIGQFEDRHQFLVSTEAGGEGLNLHRECHVMINYDLPWNPMRLVQRVGRLYRYGQKRRVIVLNMHVGGTIDAEVIRMLYDRIQQIVRDMASLSDEFSDRMQDDILGEFAEYLDLGDLIEEATQEGIERTQERMEAALQKAREAVEIHRDLFSYAAGFDPGEIRGNLAIDDRHIRSFVEEMLAPCGIAIVEKMYGNRVLDLRLPEHVAAELGINRTRHRLSFDRKLAAQKRDMDVADFRGQLFPYLIRKARSFGFGGHCASIVWPGETTDVLVAAELRWQNDQGSRMREEFTIVKVGQNATNVNDAEIVEWLVASCEPGPRPPSPPEPSVASERKKLIEAVVDSLDARLAAVSSQELHPEGRQILASAFLNTKQLSAPETPTPP